jgi:hypothetical protein
MRISTIFHKNEENRKLIRFSIHKAEEKNNSLLKQAFGVVPQRYSYAFWTPDEDNKDDEFEGDAAFVFQVLSLMSKDDDLTRSLQRGISFKGHGLRFLKKIDFNPKFNPEQNWDW